MVIKLEFLIHLTISCEKIYEEGRSSRPIAFFLLEQINSQHAHTAFTSAKKKEKQ